MTNSVSITRLESKVGIKLMKEMGAIGSSNGWQAILQDGVMHLRDTVLNPVASDTEPKRISLPPLITLPRCQTQVVTNVAMFSSSPEDEDCVVAVKFVGENFLVKRYKKTVRIIKGIAKMKTEVIMVFKLDEVGNAVYTEDIGDVVIYLSKSEPFCVTTSSFPGRFPFNMYSNWVEVFDVDERATVRLKCFTSVDNTIYRDGFGAP